MNNDISIDELYDENQILDSHMNQIKLGDRGTTYALFDTLPETITFFSASGHRELLIKRERNQFLIFYSVTRRNCQLSNLNIFQSLREKCKKKYGNKVKLVLVTGILRCNFHDENWSWHFEDSLFLFKQYNCVFQKAYTIEGITFVDSNGVIKYIIPQFGHSPLIEEEIMYYIDLLVNTNNIITLFPEKLFLQYKKELLEIIHIFDQKMNTFNLMLFTYYYAKEDLYFFQLEITLDNFQGKQDCINNIPLIKEYLQKYIDLGIIVRALFMYKPPITLTLNKQCNRCKCSIDTTKEYSYVCVKCKNKQYCNKCIHFFDSFKKFGSQLTILKEIEEYNTYLNNGIIDDLPCEHHHLLMIVSPLEEKEKKDIITLNIEIPTYVEYTPSNRDSTKCRYCYYYFPDEYIRDSVQQYTDYELSPDNSLYEYYSERRQPYALHHFQRGCGNYSPLFSGFNTDDEFYYSCWECMIYTSTFIKLKDTELYEDTFLRHYYCNSVYEKDKEIELLRPNKELKEIIEEHKHFNNYDGRLKNLEKNKDRCFKKSRYLLIIQNKGIQLSCKGYFIPIFLPSTHQKKSD